MAELFNVFEKFGSSFVESGAATVERDTAEAAERAAAEKAERTAVGNIGATDTIGNAAKKANGWKLDSTKVGLGLAGAAMIAPHMVGDVVHAVAKEFHEVTDVIGGAACEGFGLPKPVCEHPLLWAMGAFALLAFGPKLL